MYRDDDSYEENEYVSKRGIGLIGGLIGLLIGLLLYPADTYERESFFGGWKKGFFIAIVLIGCYFVFVVASILFFV